MGFAGTAGVKVDLGQCPTDTRISNGTHLFAETPARIVFEVAAENAAECGFHVIGETTGDGKLVITHGHAELINAPLAELKALWKNGLTPYY
jgi:phosphoribosylformylglycinamidine synthase